MKYIKFALGFAFLLCTLCINTFAQEKISITLNSSSDSLTYGQNFSLVPFIFGGKNCNISTFRMKIHFNPEYLKYKGISPIGEVLSSEIKANQTDGEITVIFLTEAKGINIAEGPLEIFKTEFEASHICGNTEISAQVDGLGDFNATPILVEDIKPTSILIEEITEDMLQKCSLKMLKPVNAVLRPEFSSENLNYSVDVPASCNSIEFYADATDPEAIVKINRKKLKKAGNPTQITITVTSADKKCKMIYKVTVNRLEKDEYTGTQMPETSEPKPQKTQQIKNSDKANRAQNFKNSDNDNDNSESNEYIPQKRQSTIIIKENNFYAPLFYSLSIITIIILFFLYNKKASPNR